MQDSINKININIAVLMVKVALIATVSGVIAAGVVSFVVRYLSK
jgi:biopolymer transport protein ExbB/TolQ